VYTFKGVYNVEGVYIVEGVVDKLSDERPSAGTTVTVYNLFHKQPVRKKHTNETKSLKEIVELVQGLAISLAGKISLSLRDEQNGKVLINTSRITSIKGFYLFLISSVSSSFNRVCILEQIFCFTLV